MHSKKHKVSAAKTLLEVLERMKITGAERLNWLVLEWNSQILWMQGVEVDSAVKVVAKRIPGPTPPS